MGGVYGTDKTKATMLAIVALGAFTMAQLDDGFQVGDLTSLANKLATDDEFRQIIIDGAGGAMDLSNEVSELDTADWLELAKNIPDLIEAFKKYHVKAA